MIHFGSLRSFNDVEWSEVPQEIMYLAKLLHLRLLELHLVQELGELEELSLNPSLHMWRWGWWNVANIVCFCWSLIWKMWNIWDTIYTIVLLNILFTLLLHLESLQVQRWSHLMKERTFELEWFDAFFQKNIMLVQNIAFKRRWSSWSLASSKLSLLTSPSTSVIPRFKVEQLHARDLHLSKGFFPSCADIEEVRLGRHQNCWATFQILSRDAQITSNNMNLVTTEFVTAEKALSSFKIQPSHNDCHELTLFFPWTATMFTIIPQLISIQPFQTGIDHSYWAWSPICLTKNLQVQKKNINLPNSS